MGIASTARPPEVIESTADAATSEFYRCFNEHREELFSYLVQRFGSVSLARRVMFETAKRLCDSNVLLMVGNPRVYLMGYALSLGLQFLQEDAVAANRRSDSSVQNMATGGCR